MNNPIEQPVQTIPMIPTVRSFTQPLIQPAKTNPVDTSLIASPVIITQPNPMPSVVANSESNDSMVYKSEKDVKESTKPKKERKKIPKDKLIKMVRRGEYKMIPLKQYTKLIETTTELHKIITKIKAFDKKLNKEVAVRIFQ